MTDDIRGLQQGAQIPPRALARIGGGLFPAILLPALAGEASLCLWLLVKGVDVDKWNVWTRG